MRGSAEAVAVPLGRPVRPRRWSLRVAGLGLAALVAIWLAHRPTLSYYRVTSGSMEPTLAVGGRVAIERRTGPPAIGDIVVFHPPQGADPVVPVCGTAAQGAGQPQACGVPTAEDPKITFIKRVVAGPGDLVSVVNGRAVVNGRPSSEPFVQGCSDASRCDFPTPVRVPAGDYFVLGDNRDVSDDSRFWGPVPATSIVGVAVHCSWLGSVCRADH
jgi:signal peptidase I